ncbi:hypothetical protein, partial [Nonomuraea deserti]|uniref:hypothetical protein n=1 Tax=Nonomuraea deserti TaxID=1848322 RepID=UPI003F6DA907
RDSSAARESSASSAPGPSASSVTSEPRTAPSDRQRRRPRHPDHRARRPALADAEAGEPPGGNRPRAAVRAHGLRPTGKEVRAGQVGTGQSRAG